LTGGEKKKANQAPHCKSTQDVAELADAGKERKRGERRVESSSRKKDGLQTALFWGSCPIEGGGEGEASFLEKKKSSDRPSRPSSTEKGRPGVL